jgi:hypothetical protein
LRAVSTSAAVNFGGVGGTWPEAAGALENKHATDEPEQLPAFQRARRLTSISASETSAWLRLAWAG